MSDGTKTLYERLGGYNAIAAVANDLLSIASSASARCGRQHSTHSFLRL